MFPRLSQQAFFLLLQIFLEGFELRQLILRLEGLDQHYLHVTQFVQVIELVFKEMAHFLKARVRVNGTQDIEHRQQPPRGYAQIMDRFLGEFASARFELNPIFVPTSVKRCNQRVFSLLVHYFLSMMSS